MDKATPRSGHGDFIGRWLGVTVVTASGDNLVTCGLQDGKAHVWFAASAPYVLGCGGASVSTTAGEKVWNDGSAGTGGGISDCDEYPVPAFQSAANVPNSVNDGRTRRGVPDVAAMASEPPGYRVVVNGEEWALDGASAATPLWAGLIAIVNAARGTPLGLANPALYAAPELMHPVTTGDNRRRPWLYGDRRLKRLHRAGHAARRGAPRNFELNSLREGALLKSPLAFGPVWWNGRAA